jgi:hypothetical protein
MGPAIRSKAASGSAARTRAADPGRSDSGAPRPKLYSAPLALDRGLLLRVGLAFAAALLLYAPLRDGHRHFALAWACALLGDQSGLGLVWVAGPHDARILGGCQREVSVTLTDTTLDTALAGIVLLPALAFARRGVLWPGLRRLGRWTLTLLLLQGPQLALLGWAAGQRLTGVASGWSRAAELAGNAAGWGLPLLIAAFSAARGAAAAGRIEGSGEVLKGPGPGGAAPRSGAGAGPGQAPPSARSRRAECACGSGKRWRRCCGRASRG